MSTPPITQSEAPSVAVTFLCLTGSIIALKKVSQVMYETLKHLLTSSGSPQRLSIVIRYSWKKNGLSGWTQGGKMRKRNETDPLLHAHLVFWGSLTRTWDLADNSYGMNTTFKMLHRRVFQFGEVCMDECEIIHSSGFVFEFQIWVGDKYNMERSNGGILKPECDGRIAVRIYRTVVTVPCRF